MVFSNRSISEFSFIIQLHNRDSNYNAPCHDFQVVRQDGTIVFIPPHSNGKSDKFKEGNVADTSLMAPNFATAEHDATVDWIEIARFF